MRVVNLIKTIKSVINQLRHQHLYYEDYRLLLGRLLSEEIKKKGKVNSLEEIEFKIFSQCGDDGIIQYLINNLQIPNKTFIEFGVQDYRESTTRFLMMNNNWSGFIMDASENNISKIVNSEYYWKYELVAKYAFVNSENINELISAQSFEKDLGLLHIDIDGNDYWVWKAIDVIRPIIVIVEYNSVFGIDRAITIPYDKDFYRTKAHYSNLYFGASLPALYQLGQSKGYGFIGCTSSGNNAYFVRKDKLNDVIKEVSIKEGYVLSKSRESRDEKGNLTYVTGKERIKLIKGMPVLNVETNQIEEL